jgi:hypothetical protein
MAPRLRVSPSPRPSPRLPITASALSPSPRVSLSPRPGLPHPYGLAKNRLKAFRYARALASIMSELVPMPE